MPSSNWTSDNAYRADRGSSSAPAYPHEYLVKTLSSSANSGLSPMPKSSRILEIGAFGANNLRFFWEKGFKNLYGIEVSPSLVDMCKTSAAYLLGNEYPLDNISLGSNLQIDFPDHYFDLIVSVNTLHYCIGDQISTALDLWKSKLRPNGRLFVETAGPKHDYVLDSTRQGLNHWQWGAKAGFRQGTDAGFFDDEQAFQSMVASKFAAVSFGRVTEVSELNTVDFLTAYCSLS